MDIELIEVPYDSGYCNIRTGCGPDYLIQNGITKFLEAKGHNIKMHRVESNLTFNTEIGTAFELNRLLAEHISLTPNYFPVILSGNCNSCIGTLGGLNSNDIGIIWFDAHGDFNTPDSTISGFLDGMGLAMAAGRCWKALLQKIPGYKPIPESNVIHVGALDLDTTERQMFIQAGIPIITKDSENEGAFISAFKNNLMVLSQKVKAVYLHIDMDVLETGYAKANHLAVTGGLSIETVVNCLKLIKENFKVSALGIASLDPAFDRDKIVLNAGFRIIEAVLEN